MQTLLLFSSSKFLENDLSPFLGKPLGKFRIALITTASKGRGVRNTDYLEHIRNRLDKANCSFEEIDLDKKNIDELRNTLKNFNAVFVAGGNTFYLLKSIRESGFDIIVKELLPTGFIYMGASAGAYVACPTIEMATWKHEKYDRYGMTDFTAMNIIPFLVSVHYDPMYKTILKTKIANTSTPVKILSDEQAILIKDDVVELLGGPEIKLT